MARAGLRRRLCRGTVAAFALVYLGALALAIIGLRGWFGVAPDPLAGLFVVMLGQPWAQFIDRTPQAAWPWLAALSPAANLLILAGLCRLLGPRRAV